MRRRGTCRFEGDQNEKLTIARKSDFWTLTAATAIFLSVKHVTRPVAAGSGGEQRLRARLLPALTRYAVLHARDPNATVRDVVDREARDFDATELLSVHEIEEQLIACVLTRNGTEESLDLVARKLGRRLANTTSSSTRVLHVVEVDAFLKNVN